MQVQFNDVLLLHSFKFTEHNYELKIFNLKVQTHVLCLQSPKAVGRYTTGAENSISSHIFLMLANTIDAQIAVTFLCYVCLIQYLITQTLQPACKFLFSVFRGRNNII